MSYIYQLVTGDWSEDGHSQKDHFRFETSHDREAIIAAYIKTANLARTSVCAFPGFTGLVVCSDYEDQCIPEEAVKGLAKVGITREQLIETTLFEEVDELCDDLTTWGGEGLAELFMLMVTKSLPDFTYEHCKVKNFINGYWQSDFNCSIGYGAYGS